MKPNIFSGFKTWLRRQPRNRQFTYSSPTECVLATFLKDRGILNPMVGPSDVRLGHTLIDIPTPIYRALHKAVKSVRRDTLDRCPAVAITPKLVLKYLK